MRGVLHVDTAKYIKYDYKTFLLKNKCYNAYKFIYYFAEKNKRLLNK